MTADAKPMSSNRPYLLRAMYEWIVDNGYTPHLLVDAAHPGLMVPPQSIKDGKVVLNVAARAVAQLELGNVEVSFMARFSGVSHSVRVPLPAVLAIYAAETGQGMGLPDDGATPMDPDEPSPSPGGASDGPKKGGHLRIVK